MELSGRITSVRKAAGAPHLSRLPVFTGLRTVLGSVGAAVPFPLRGGFPGTCWRCGWAAWQCRSG